MDLRFVEGPFRLAELQRRHPQSQFCDSGFAKLDPLLRDPATGPKLDLAALGLQPQRATVLYAPTFYPSRSEEHTSELQSLMRISYAVFCLKKKKTTTQQH